MKKGFKERTFRFFGRETAKQAGLKIHRSPHCCSTRTHSRTHAHTQSALDGNRGDVWKTQQVQITRHVQMSCQRHTHPPTHNTHFQTGTTNEALRSSFSQVAGDWSFSFYFLNQLFFRLSLFFQKFQSLVFDRNLCVRA